MRSETAGPLFEIADEFSLISKGVSYRAAEIREAADAAAKALRDLGVGRGDRVAMCAPKSFEFCVLMFATWTLGAVAVPMFSGLKAEQVRHILHDSDPRLVFAGARDIDLVRSAYGDSVLALETLKLRGEAGPLARDVPNRADSCDAMPDAEPALIVYTSGSTGLPKGVVFSRGNLVLGAKSVARFTRLASDDRVLCVLPFSFDAGLNQLLSALIVGATAVLIDFMHAGQIEDACAKHGVTTITAVPGLWSRVAAVRWRDEARMRVRRVCNTGGHLQAALLRKLQTIFSHADVFPMYGFTEAFRAAYLEPSMVAKKPYSIGRSIPFASIAVVSEDGRLCGPGEIGELIQFGPLVTSGYRNRPEENAVKFRALPEGLLSALMGPEGRRYAFDPTHAGAAAWSGDLVSIDEDGDLVYRGRKDDLIKVNGFRICPGDVEAGCLDAGLSAAVAIGVIAGDDESIVVFGKRNDSTPDEAALIDRLKQTLPAYMVPRRIVLLDELPLNANGKFDRTALKALAVPPVGVAASAQ